MLTIMSVVTLAVAPSMPGFTPPHNVGPCSNPACDHMTAELMDGIGGGHKLKVIDHSTTPKSVSIWGLGAGDHDNDFTFRDITVEPCDPLDWEDVTDCSGMCITCRP